jgi:FAD:protein FMN transferase
VIVLFLLGSAVISLPAAARPVPGAQSQPAAEMLRVEESADSMGSTYSVVAYGPDRAVLIGALDQAFEEVRRLDHLLSNYRPASEWSQVNKFAAQRPVEVSEEVFALLSACMDYSRRSEGAFDISVGPLMKLWGFYRGTGRLPHKAELMGALARIGYKNVILDPAKRTVRFAREGVELDPGGIGKGYAVDRMIGVLKSAGIQSALVSAAGSSIYALGAPPDAQGWKIKIRDPHNSAKTVEEVTLRDASLSTSGNYEKFFRAEGKLYSHIMDPRTGYPAQGMLSVSVISPRTQDSEAWTKPFYINGRQWAAQHKPAGFRVFLCEDRGEQPCAWLQ